MRNRAARRVAVRYTWDRMRVSFWFAPVVMALGAILLARGMYWVDDYIPNQALLNSHLVLSGSVVELRNYLFSMATTVLATAGVVFTLLTLPLSTVAAQYGSRLLRVFLGDRTTQLVLGMFVATFVYCLAAATSLPPVEVPRDAPQITATVGMYLMLATFASLIALVQHISTMLQAPNIAAAAGAELQDVLRAEIPWEVTSRDEKSQDDQGAPDTPPVQITGTLKPGEGRPNTETGTDVYPVRIKDTGYIQYIDPETLLTLAKDKNLVIRLLHKPGHFVRSGAVVALVWPASRFNKQLEGQIFTAIRLGNTRTPTQDIVYAVNQLVEMAVRAMSPAINDPFTAMTCLDYIAEGLAQYIRQGEKGSHYYGLEGRLRLVFEPVTFEELLSAAFDMLRHASCDNASVLLYMLKAVDVIGQETKPPEARQALLRQVDLIRAESQSGRLIETDRQLIQTRCDALQTKLIEVQ